MMFLSKLALGLVGTGVLLAIGFGIYRLLCLLMRYLVEHKSELAIPVKTAISFIENVPFYYFAGASAFISLAVFLPIFVAAALMIAGFGFGIYIVIKYMETI